MLCNAAGEILPVHVTTQPPDKDDYIKTMLNNLASKPEEITQLTEEDKNRASDLLQQLQAIFVVAKISKSILLFVHLLTSDILKSVHEMYDSGQLNDIVRDLFRCLAKDETLSAEVKISADAFKECGDGFAENGKSNFRHLTLSSFCLVYLIDIRHPEIHMGASALY